MGTDRSSITLRVAEVIHTTPEPITAREALKRVLAQRFDGDPDGLLEYAVSAGAAALKNLRQATYKLDGDAPALFRLPAVIAVTTDEGDLFVRHDDATLGQVRQWATEGVQHHSVQEMRFRRLLDEVEKLDGLPDETLWAQAQNQLGSAAA